MSIFFSECEMKDKHDNGIGEHTSVPEWLDGPMDGVKCTSRTETGLLLS